MSQNVSQLELFRKPIASARAELASASCAHSSRVAGVISFLRDRTTLNDQDIRRVLGVRESQLAIYPDLADTKLTERAGVTSDEWALIEGIMGNLPLPLPPAPPSAPRRRTLIDTRNARPRSRTRSAQMGLPGVVKTLAETRPGPNKEEMDWLARQLQATAEDRASGKVEPFDQERLEREFLPWIIAGDPELKDRFVALVHEYMTPGVDTVRLYGYPFKGDQIPEMEMPAALKGTLKARKEWLAHARLRAEKRDNEANVGRVSMTRTPVATIGPDHSVEGILVLDPESNPALKQWQPLFPGSVVDAAEADDILSEGAHNAKLGDVMTVGGLTGFKIMTINLAERSTCDIGCPSGDVCFGNGMHRATRIHPDETYYDKLAASIALHQRAGGRKVDGLTPLEVRAHTLGDYYEPEYVDVCDDLIEKTPGHLAFWVITARLHSKHPMAYLDFRRKKTRADFDESTAIGDRLLAWQLKRPHNVQLWFSSQLPLPGSFTTLFANPFNVVDEGELSRRFMRLEHGIVCPAEIQDTDKVERMAAIHAKQRAANPNFIEATKQGATGRVDTCGDCGYCQAPMPGMRGAVYVTVHGPAPGRPAGT